MSEEPAVRRGGTSDGTSGRTGRRPRRAPRRTPGGSADNRRTPVPEEQLARRRALVPEITYPEDLPVSERRDDIAAAIRDHQVVVVAGETGSGKTTQLPKICLELGRGIEGTIGHTQPRRIAARAVAERVAEELGVELGGAVGYQVRFADHSSRDTLVKVMTDGILLAELQRDRDLRRYDTIIIDEAHERSLNVDFLLGYLKRLLPRRPDLKVIITSATIDPQRFADHFAAPGRPVPVVEVSGRTYPVEVRYRPLEREEEGAEPVDQVTGIVEAVEELWTESRGDGGSQDILVFLSGEREIRDGAEALSALNLPATEVLPLFGRLSAAEQHRVFSRHDGRRIVLSTNVAETSLTVPGIRYVVDTGTARISRYSQRTKVQRLPIEPISQASANQRSGRCGRLADGICIRLYAEEDYLARPEFTDPEILRTNLASVILQMTSLRLGDVARFPFLDPPDSRQITDGVRLLEELRAVETTPDTEGREARRQLTAYGKRLAQLPVDPRLGRMLLEADRLGCLREVLVVVSAMSIQDPRERPLERQELANAAHKRFADEHSDFAAYLNLWRYLQEQQKALSGSAFRRMCKAEFLHYLRIREWQDLHQQLRQAAKSAGLDTSRSARQGEPDLDTMHRALLAGLLSHVGSRDEVKREYLGARGARFGISPGSSLFRKQPQFVMAGELVETTRLWARDVARIDPLWAEEAGEHLVKRSYSEPRWSAKQGSAVATERVTLYGVPIVLARTVGYARVDAAESRHLFIQRALVEGDWTTRHRFFHDNTALVERLSELEARTRRRDLIVGDEALYAFYDKRIPRRGGVGAALRLLVEEGRASGPDAADLHRGPAPVGPGRPGRHRRVPHDLAAGGPRPRRDVPLRAGEPRGRRHRARPRRGAQPRDRRRVRLAGQRPSGGPRHRADSQPAQGDPATAGARAGARRCSRAGAARARARPVRRAAHRRPGPGGPGDAGRRRRPSGLGRRPGAVAPAGPLLGRGRSGSGHHPWPRPRRAPRGRPARAAPAGLPGRVVARAVRSAHVGARRGPRGGRHHVGGRAPGPGVPRARRRRRLRVAAGPADPRRGGRRAPPGGPPAAAAQRHPALEAGAGPAQQRPEARPGAQPARVRARSSRRLPGLRRRRDRCRTAAGRGPVGGGLRGGARRGAHPSRGPGGAGRRPGRAGPGQGPRGGPTSGRR